VIRHRASRENPAAAGFSLSVRGEIVPIGMRRATRGAVLGLALAASGIAFAQGDAKRGEYLARAGGCVGCHTEAKPDAVRFAGGRALKTPFGTFYGPNITPHPEAGIGRWTEADFIRALRFGVRPDGAHYFPAFPYPSYTKISDADLRDLWAYLRTLPPSSRASEAHDLGIPFRWRFLVAGWKRLHFTPGAFTPDARLPANVNRGAYLVQALGHCGECHTPRNFLGGPKQDRFLAGGKGPDGKNVPNLTPTRLKKQSDGELKDLLTTGMTPDGDVVAETMGEVITQTTSKLTPDDLAALTAYLRSLPPLPEEPK
jgi:mono/diheme cytochrome c family protein